MTGGGGGVTTGGVAAATGGSGGEGISVGFGIGAEVGVCIGVAARERAPVGPAAGCTIIFHGPKSSGESCAIVVSP